MEMWNNAGTSTIRTNKNLAANNVNKREACEYAHGQTVMKEEPLSPEDRLFHTEALNCCIITILGFKTEVNIDSIKKWSESYLLNHSRFRSVVVGKRKWKETKVDLEKHVINVNFDPKMGCTADEFLENYMTSLTTKSMDLTKPLWELHLLKIKTCYANSTILLRIHHSMGDGLSLISLLLASSFQTSNPGALPSFPTSNKRNIMKDQVMKKKSSLRILMKWLVFTMWYFFMLIFNTLVDAVAFFATISFLKDTNTPIKRAAGVELTPKRFVHRIISLDDIKTVKVALNMTVNDVILGITQGGLSRYLNRRYASSNKNDENAYMRRQDLPNNIRLRATVPFSQKIKTLAGATEKKSKVKLENSFGFVLLPLTVELLDDPIDYVRKAKSTVDRKKLSLEGRCSRLIASILPTLIGYKFASAIIYKGLLNTTLIFSNVPGPVEEISMADHPLAYIAPSIYGMPHALTVHFQSYCNKMVIAIAVDTNLIPDPHQLCEDIDYCLKTIKQSIM